MEDAAGAVRASPKHLENGDFCNEDSYGFMSHELQKRVGPCPAEVSQSWLERGGSGLPAPVWVWQQFRSRAQPEYVPEPWVCGERAVLLEAEVPREEDIPLPLTEEEDEELSALKTTEPEAFRERKLQSWQRIFEVEWEGDTIYGLQHGDDAQLQAVLWQLPLSALVRPALRFVNLAPYVSEEKRSVAYPPHGPPLGEDVQLDAVWIRRKSTNPPLHLQFTVKHLVTEGLAAKRVQGGEISYDDEVELVDESGNYLQQIRPQMGGRNRMRNVGLHTIEIYYPQFYFKQTEMEEFDARPDRYGPSVIGKYTKGIGMIEARYPTDDEERYARERSFSMTVTHRLIERMEKANFNETYRYMPDGNRLPCWNSVGRLDIGSESLIDRSKSMKAYVMDLFERYGSGEGNIEGVDMYNACYGGQAAGLCAQNWVESDRWDGRYAIAIATDISDAPFEVIFSVGAACTAALYYPVGAPGSGPADHRAALLRVASNSSVVVRVGHTMSNPQTPLNPQVIYVAVPTLGKQLADNGFDPSLTQVLSVLCRELHEQLGRRWAPAVSLRLLQQPANNRLCPRAAAFAEARHRASELQRGGATTAGTQTETLAKLKLG
eukprot:g15030.t1